MRKGWTIGTVIAVGLIAASCSSSSKSSIAASPTTGGAPATTATVGGAAAGSPIIAVATDPKLGQLLVGANGHTVYLFEDDKGTSSACTGGCAATWPALSAPGTPPVGAGLDQTKLSTAAGQVANQAVYNGHLLYYFSGDAKPGDVNGITIPHWDAIAPSGAKVETGN
jgi:predicted lipoprotein with Yx(FWY)xxD motif